MIISMPKQISCPYCGVILNIDEDYTLDCPRCRNTFRVRDGKSYKNEEIAPEMLSYIVLIFAYIAK